jgi:hypothetical protein
MCSPKALVSWQNVGLETNRPGRPVFWPADTWGRFTEARIMELAQGNPDDRDNLDI